MAASLIPPLLPSLASNFLLISQSLRLNLTRSLSRTNLKALNCFREGKSDAIWDETVKVYSVIHFINNKTHCNFISKTAEINVFAV